VYRLLFVLNIFEVKEFIERKLININKKEPRTMATKV
jgi:hypothetical protein